MSIALSWNYWRHSTIKCPVCSGIMTEYRDSVGRRWAKCLLCNAQIPLENGFREVQDE